MKKITYKEAIKINNRLGLETWEDDDVKLYWATDDKETATWAFESLRERNKFVETNEG